MAIATGIEELALNGFSIDSMWEISRFTDGWFMSKVKRPELTGELPSAIGGWTRISILDDGDAQIINSSSPPVWLVEGISNVTDGLGMWSAQGYYEIEVNSPHSKPTSGKSVSIPVVFGDRASYTAPVDVTEAAQAAAQKADELDWPEPDTTGYRFTDGWLLRANEKTSWWEPDTAIKRFVVLDTGVVCTEDGPQRGSDSIRKFSQAQPDNLRLWYPTGYVDIRSDGSNHWVHTNQESPIQIWAGPQHT